MRCVAVSDAHDLHSVGDPRADPLNRVHESIESGVGVGRDIEDDAAKPIVEVLVNSA
jgi:hypothetical protein